jgi:hypothetical protein
MVTLGSYDTEKEAELRYDAVVEEGYYESLIIEALEPRPTDSDG